MANHFSRRDFLAVSAATAATALLARGGQPTESKPGRTLRKAVMYGMIGAGKTVEDKFKILKDTGFAGVEMDSPTSLSMGEILAAQAKIGITVHGLVDSAHWKYYLNAPDQEAQEEGVKALETCLRDGKKLSCISILLVPGVVRAGLSYDDCWKLTQKNIRRVLPLAKECGVKIAIENVWNNFIMSPMEAARYVDELGGSDSMVAWHFDIGNVINYGWPDQWVRILNKRIAKLHIKDYSRKKRDNEGLWKGFDVELGEGDAGWPAVMKALDEVGYSTSPQGNWATAEVGGGDEKRLKTVSEQMDKLFSM